VIGVIPISRKAAAVAEAGPEFTPDELGKLLAICKPAGKTDATCCERLKGSCASLH
jgi:hypothetical protein